jgi:ribosomal protein S21
MCDKANYKAQMKQINYYELMALKEKSKNAVLSYVECLRQQATGR